MSLTQKLAKIPTKTKHTVYGWIREAEREMTASNLPTMIAGICVIYYAQKDKFIYDYACKLSQLEVSLDRKRVTKLSAHDVSEVSAENWVYSHQQRIYRWTLLINNPSYIMISTFIGDKFYKYCNFGKLDTNFNFENKYNENVWIAFGNGEQTMKVTLNTETRKISFQIDGKSAMSCDLETGPDIQYKLAVGLRHKNSYVQIDKCEEL